MKSKEFEHALGHFIWINPLRVHTEYTLRVDIHRTSSTDASNQCTFALGIVKYLVITFTDSRI